MSFQITTPNNGSDSLLFKNFNGNLLASISSFDNTGAGNLIVQTNGANALWVDTNQNLGVGGTPSAWGTGRGGIELFGSTQPSVSFSGATANNGGSINTNTYNNGAGSWLYKNAGYASVLQTVNGGFQWYTAPSGSAGGTVSLTQVMGLNNSGIVTMPSQPGFFAAQSGGSIASGTDTELTGYATPSVNRGSNFNASTGRFTAPVAGLYSFNGYAQWSSSTSISAGTVLYVYIKVNSTTITRTQIDQIVTGDSQSIPVALVYQLNATDYVSFWVYQSSGSNKTLNSYAFMGHLIG